MTTKTNTATKVAPKKVTKSPQELAKLRSKNKANNKAKQTAKGHSTGKGKITYLKAGVTGKQVMQAQRDSNNAHKEDFADFKTCLKRAKEFDKGYITKFKLTRKMLTENGLKAFMSENEKARQTNNVAKLGYERYTVWGVQQLIRRMAKSKVA